MSFSHTILVTAAGGNIGHSLIPQLLAHPSFKLVLPTSNAERLRSKLPTTTTPEENIAIEQGNIADPAWVQEILTAHKVDTVFLCLTGTDELQLTLRFLSAMEHYGVNNISHLIYLSAAGSFATGRGLEEMMAGTTASHILTKPWIEQKILYSGWREKTTVLGPALFFNNDLRSKDSLMRDGFLGFPLGERGVSRVSTVDIATAVCNAILTPERWKGKKIMLGSRHWYTGTEISGIWSRALGREVKIRGMGEEELGAFEKFMDAVGEGTEKGRGWGRDMRLMYQYFGSAGFGFTGEQYEVQVELLGREPESDGYEGWVVGVAEGWRGEGE